MPLIKCPMCQNEISSNAEKCPHCGKPMQKSVEINDTDICNLILVNNGNEPMTMLKNVYYSKALEIKQTFEELGAKVEIVSADKMNTNFIDKSESEFTIKCPNCQSANVHKIGGLSKAGSVAMFGIFAMGKVSKTYQCNKCGYRW